MKTMDKIRNSESKTKTFHTFEIIIKPLVVFNFDYATILSLAVTIQVFGLTYPLLLFDGLFAKRTACDASRLFHATKMEA